MSIFEAVFLAVLQGITDFLPISTSGHLLLFQRIFGQEEGRFTYIIVLHVATLIPVIVVYFNRIKSLVKNPFQKLMLLLVLGTIPAVIAALLLGDVIDTLFTGNFLPYAFLATAVILIVTDKAKQGTKKGGEITKRDAICIGIAQAIAIIPGVSRSGSTIGAAVACDIDREEAANFSFMLSIPAAAGATVLEIRQIIIGATNLEFVFSLPVILGFFAAMLACYISIKIMLKMVVESKLRYFSYYLIVVASLILFDQLVTNFVF